MATQVSLLSGAVASAGTLKLQSNGTTDAITIGTDQSVTTANTINGLTVGKGAGSVSTNTAVGASALEANTTGSDIVAIGYQALKSNTTGYSDAVGSGALYSSNADGNSAFAYQAAYSTTSGIFNSAFGNRTLYSNTTGSYNVAFGPRALYSNTTANYNTAVGYQAGYSGATSAGNTFLGTAAGYSNTGNGYNTFVGRNAGYSVTSGYGNTFVGCSYSNQSAGYYVTSGNNNTIIGGYSGNQGGLDIRTASNYIVLSDGDGNPRGYYDGANDGWTFGYNTTSGTDAGRINLRGSDATGWGPRAVGYANNSVTWQVGSYSAIVSGANQYLTCKNLTGGVYLNGTSATSWTAVSDETRKIIIEDITDAATKVATLRTVIGRLKSDDETVRRPYLIAQDVQAVLPEAVSETEDKEGAVLGLSYTEVIPLLVAAIKELKAEIDAYKEAHP